MPSRIVMEHPVTHVRVAIGREYLQTFYRRNVGPRRAVINFRVQAGDPHVWSTGDELRVLTKAGWRLA